MRIAVCVCVRFFCFCVNYMTRIYHLFLDLFLSIFGKLSALLPTRTTCCPADLLKNVPLEVFSVVISYLPTPHSIVTQRTTRLRCRGLPRLGFTDHQCRFSGMLDPMTFHQPVVSQLGASSLQLELEMKSRRFGGALPRTLP